MSFNSRKEKCEILYQAGRDGKIPCPHGEGCRINGGWCKGCIYNYGDYDENGVYCGYLIRNDDD